MELSAELFAELTDGAHYEIEPPTASLRQARRVRVLLEATVVRLNRGKHVAALPATIRDLSCRGVGIECSMTVRVNDEFALRLHRRDGSPLWIYCAVARWQPIAKNLNAIGAKFTRLFVPPKPLAADAQVPADATNAPAAA